MFLFLVRFTKFLRRFCPWLIAHMLVFGISCAFAAAEVNGYEGAREYYYPLLAGIIASLPFALCSYFMFGRQSIRYSDRNLGDFDKYMIYSLFGGSPSWLFGSLAAKKLREAVIDMHVFDYNTALDKYKELEDENLSDKQRSVLCFYTARCYQLMGYPSNGVIFYKQAIELGLDTNDTYLLTARCLTQNGRFDEAVEYYTILLERDCYFDFIYTDIGIAYLKKGDGEKALENFERSVDEGKNYSFALGGCSLACLQLKNLEKSNEYYKKALTCNMDDVSGFKTFYCNIAEAVGLLDEIDPEIRNGSDKDAGEIRINKF